MVLLLAAAAVPSALRAAPPAAPPAENALQLYQEKHYDDAYRAFESLAEKHPEQGSLQFNAGASAYMGKQYDEALDAFGKAMTSDNGDLQAKANYNFGNTLFRRGADNKDRDQKITDWKNALQHYDATLNALKQRGPQGDQRLATDTAFNRDLVKKRLDEALKEPPPPPQNKSSKQDQKPDDKQDKNNQQGKSGQQNKDNPQDKDGQQNKPPAGSDDQKQSGQEKPGENQPPKPDQSQQGQGKDQQGSQAPNQPVRPAFPARRQTANPPARASRTAASRPRRRRESSDQKDDSQGEPKNDPNGSQGDKPPNPAANKPREHGDFQAKPGEKGDPSKGQPANQKPGGEPADEPGKMNASQARALLNSLKDEDAHVDLGGDSRRQHANDDPPLKDW